MDDAIEADEEVAQERVNEIGSKSEVNLSSIVVEDARSLGTKRTVSALILPPQRQDSIGSIESIMEVVRERVGMLQGTIAGGLLAGSEAEDWNPRWKGSPKTTRFSEESPSFYMPSPSRALETSPKRQQTAKSTPASRFRNREVPDEEQNPFQVGVPFRCAVMCPTVIMLVAFILVFVPLALFSLDTQRATFRNYAHSVATQKELISSIVLNATQWVLLEASKSVEQAVFVGIVEPPDRAVDTLTGAIRMSRSRDGWDFTSALQRRGLSHRAWEELNNQWTCTQLNNNLCSGRALSLYAALDEEEVMGAAFRPSYWAQTLAKEAPFLLDAPAMKGKNTTLSVYEAHSEHGARGEFFVSRPIRPTQMPFYLTQVKLAQKAMSASAKNDAEMRAEAKLKKMWSPVYLFHPWWEGENASTGGQLALSWTTPLAMCGNYSCVDGVVAADTTLDLVSYELALAWYRLQSNLLGPPWSFQLSEQNSSIFIVKQLAPMFPDQEGLLIGASDFRSALVEGRLIHATESPSKIVAATAKAVLRRFGAWNASELTRRGKEQSFHFSLRDAHEGKWEECHPLVDTKGTPEDKDWEENCFQATTHTIFLDDSLQWLVVASLPAAAFSKFYVDEAMKVEMQVKREQMEAHEKQRDTLIECGFLGILAAAMVLVMGLVTSILVLRPLSRLSLLMRRLTELDFAHDSVEYRKMQDGQAGRILEINELSHGFCRLSHSIEVFARFVPDSVVRRLISGDPKASRLNVLRKDVTIMFSDVRDFTSISEELKQDDLILLLTVYLSVMTRIIESFEGVVGEILGDGILAFWNTPDDVSSHPAKACAAALSQQQALGPLNEEFQKLGLPALAIRIGIHTGEVLTGNIGCLSGKMKFGCMGDPVNLASRLEGLCKTYGVGVLCSQTTRDRLPPEDGFVCRMLDLVQVKGKKEPTVIYEVIGRDLKGGKADDTLPMNTKQPILPERPTLLSSPCVSPRKLRHKIGSTPEVMCWEPVHPNRITQAQMYEEAWTAYSKQKFSEATHLASQLLEERPEDVAAQRLFKRSASLAAKVAEGTDPAFLQELAEWTAVASMTEK